VGYFHANERSDDVELGNVAKNIGDHIYRYFPQAAILLVCILSVVDDVTLVCCFLLAFILNPFVFFFLISL
jgi:hypothetical protein